MIAAEPQNRWKWRQAPYLLQFPTANSQSWPSFSLGPSSNKWQNCIPCSVLHLPHYCSPLSGQVSQEVLHQGERFYLKTPTAGNNQESDKMNLVSKCKLFCSPYSETWWVGHEYVENDRILHLEKRCYPRTQSIPQLHTLNTWLHSPRQLQDWSDRKVQALPLCVRSLLTTVSAFSVLAS